VALRVILGILALVCGSVSFVMFTTATREMVDQVNERLPEADQFGPVLSRSNSLRLHREYKELFPCGHLSRRVNLLVVLMFACMLTCAWSLGLFGK
jgi:hypothetical protein